MNHPRTEKPCSVARMFGCMVYDAMVLAAILFAVTTITLAMRQGAAIAPGNTAYQAFSHPVPGCTLPIAGAWAVKHWACAPGRFTSAAISPKSVGDRAWYGF